ncbi:hypothetical protein [Arthrospiribacter ruber]|uniref:Uncharacterized protein n=1 Tax=Arthrospiribacter ruber TaxID=2487934 RepID=A0A951IZY2_9BACT|nr:hypothetical protein [Arthrospiribacter ruber]MBW3470038.1 hypothetical protein [Arthrospiribacter ruber]
MLRNVDYQRIFNLIDTISLLHYTSELADILSQSFKSIKPKSKVQSNDLYYWVCGKEELKNLLSEPGDQETDLDIFLYLYIHIVLKESIIKLQSKQQIDNLLKVDSMSTANALIREELGFSISSYLIRTGGMSWRKLSDNSDSRDWTSIFFLSNLLPFSELPIVELGPWIGEIVKNNERDMALQSIGKSIKEWATYSTEDTKNFEDEIPNILTNQYSKQFLPAIMQGLRARQEKNLQYYIELFAENVSDNSTYEILHAIGSTLRQENTERNDYFTYITEKRNSGSLKAEGFIRLCSRFRYLSRDVLEYVTSVLNSNDINIYLAAVDLLFHNEEIVDMCWYKNTVMSIIKVGEKDLTGWQQTLLSGVIEKDTNFAYELLHSRISNLGGSHFLKDAFRNVAEKDPSLFRTYFISWLNSDNPLIHKAILQISALSISEQIFQMPKDVFQNYSKAELIYIGGKMVGYIYSQKPLQHSLLSLIKSIQTKEDHLTHNFTFLLSDYLVYNYRSTLKIIKEELKNKSLNKFAKSIFRSTLKEYEAYFKSLDQIDRLREIQPNSRIVQLRRFYEQKQFDSLPKEKNGLLNFIKETQVNAHRCAFRRPGDFKHEISNMGKISYEMEFPSGEILSPVYQESIRREMQLLRKDEVNID